MPITKQHRAERRAAAEARNLRWRSLTPARQLSSLRGPAKKQRARIMAILHPRQKESPYASGLEQKSAVNS